MKEIDKKIHELILGFTSKDYPIDSSYGLKDVTKGVKLILKAQRAKDKQAVMSLFAKYGKGLFSSKQLQSAIKISEGLAKIYKEVE